MKTLVPQPPEGSGGSHVSPGPDLHTPYVPRTDETGGSCVLPDSGVGVEPVDVNVDPTPPTPDDGRGSRVVKTPRTSGSVQGTSDAVLEVQERPGPGRSPVPTTTTLEGCTGTVSPHWTPRGDGSSTGKGATPRRPWSSVHVRSRSIVLTVQVVSGTTPRLEPLHRGPPGCVSEEDSTSLGLGSRPTLTTGDRSRDFAHGEGEGWGPGVSYRG